jgi:hypothetical protein
MTILLSFNELSKPGAIIKRIIELVAPSKTTGAVKKRRQARERPVRLKEPVPESSGALSGTLGRIAHDGARGIDAMARRGVKKPTRRKRRK